jgi:hypothetical protein
VAEEILDFVPLQEARFRWSQTLAWHSRHALADDEHFGRSPSDVFEHAVQGGQALIARANVITTVDFKMLEKADDPLEGEVAKRKACDLAMPIGSSELKQEPDRVAVAAHRGGTQALHRDQVVHEERMQDWSLRQSRRSPRRSSSCWRDTST